LFFGLFVWVFCPKLAIQTEFNAYHSDPGLNTKAKPKFIARQKKKKKKKDKKKMTTSRACKTESG
jgi:hypothetical protein